MSTRSLLRFLAFATSLALVTPALGDAPGLGRPVAEQEIAAVDLVVGGDGAMLPPGVSSVADGAELYAERCAGCHGGEGQGLHPLLQLAGGSLEGDGEPVKTVGSYWPTAVTLFDFIRRAMPANAPKSLADEEVYAATAYVLFLNGLLEADSSLDAGRLRSIEMPNRDGFIDYSGILD